MIEVDSKINITQAPVSKIEKLDFENLKFGREFSDHMVIMDYSDGKWHTPEILPYGPIEMSPASSVVHYGQSIFEGMKAFRNVNGEGFFFRPFENIKRFNQSAERMCMPHIPEKVFYDVLITLLRLDKAWIPTDPNAALYVRPFMFATDAYIGVKPSETYRFMIFTCPVGKYYSGSVRVKIETHYTRAAPGGVGAAKAAGNYAASLYPARKGQDEGYDQLVWTDAVEHKYIEESGTMNIVFVKGNTIFTPKPGDTILDGITRKSILQIGKDWGYNVEERKVSVDEVITLLKNGELDEAFGAGTAATIAPISSICYEGVDYPLSDYKDWKFGTKAAEELTNIKRGNSPDIHNWNHKI